METLLDMLERKIKEELEVDWWSNHYDDPAPDVEERRYSQAIENLTDYLMKKIK